MKTNGQRSVKMTLAELLEAIVEVAETQEEAFAVLELMVDVGRISVLGSSEIAVAA